MPKPIEYERVYCENPECGQVYRKMRGSPVRLCEGCLIHPNLVARFPERNPREKTERRDY